MVDLLIFAVNLAAGVGLYYLIIRPLTSENSARPWPLPAWLLVWMLAALLVGGWSVPL